MLKGVDYVHSRQKRRFDQIIAYALTPSAYIAKCIAENTFSSHRNTAIFRQPRVGRNGAIFDILKICTLDEDAIALSSFAQMFRKNGFDELAQIYNIRIGDMSVVGRRPLIAEEYIEQYEIVGDDYEGAKLVDQHRLIALPTRPGVISTYALAAHRNEAPVAPKEMLTFRLASEIEDIYNASLRHDLGMIALLGTSIFTGKMSQSSIKVWQENIQDAA